MQPAALSHIGNATWAFSQRHWRLVVVPMLLLLHIAVVRGVADPWARALLLAHLGLLLLWQPFLSVERRVSPAQGMVLSLGAIAVMLWLNWWLLAFWVVVLAGLVGGKVYQQDARWQRRAYLVMLLYLVALLAIIILPEIAPRREITSEVRHAAEYSLPLFFVLIALFPAEREGGADAAQVIDFFYSVFLMLLLVVVILGSFTFMTLGRTAYLQALSYTVLIIGGAVLLIGLAWNPRGGVAGLDVFVSRYLFSIGLPSKNGCASSPSCRTSRRGRSASSPKAWRRSRACRGLPARAGAQPTGKAKKGSAPPRRWNSRTAPCRFLFTRAIG